MKAMFLPHPVLLPGGSDYKDGCRFDMTADGPQHTMDGYILVPVSLVLDSAFLKRLVSQKKAKVVVVVQCARTYARRAYVMSGIKKEMRLPLTEYADKITLSPYVASTEPIRPFHSSEHHDEFGSMPVEVPAGAILARGNAVELTIDSLRTLGAAIQLVTNNGLEKGEYDIDLSENYIKISMQDETRRQVEALRKTNRGMLYQSVYMAALTRAMQDIEPDDDRKWAESLKKTLDGHSIKIDDDLKVNAYKHAQKLLKYPLTYLQGDGSVG